MLAGGQDITRMRFINWFDSAIWHVRSGQLDEVASSKDSVLANTSVMNLV